MSTVSTYDDLEIFSSGESLLWVFCHLHHLSSKECEQCPKFFHHLITYLTWLMGSVRVGVGRPNYRMLANKNNKADKKHKVMMG